MLYYFLLQQAHTHKVSATELIGSLYISGARICAILALQNDVKIKQCLKSSGCPISFRYDRNQSVYGLVDRGVILP